MTRFPHSTVNQIYPPIVERSFSLLNSFSSLKHLSQIHTQIIASGLYQTSCIRDNIIQFCTWESPGPNHPSQVIHFRGSVLSFSKNLRPSTWNDLIRAYAISNDDSQKKALWVFLVTRRLGIKPNEYTYPFVFKSCASFLGLFEGEQIHADVIKHGLHLNVYVQNTIISFYGLCKRILNAYKVFDGMTRRTFVSWNSIISATVDCSWFYNSIDLFIKMRNSGFEPDETTMVVVLSACAEIGNLSLGKWVHSQVIGKGLIVNCQLGTALVDMYGKCGAVDFASLVFDRMEYRNVWTWSAMILGFAQHGFAERALELFGKLRNHSIKPNHVTFLGVLCACSHAGLVEDGQHYFREMEQVHKIKPKMTHYGAMVDILSRANCLKEAYDFILNMPVEADGVVWRTLLSACIVHDVKDYSGVGGKVRERLVKVDPNWSGNFVMLANSYAESEMWENATKMRRRMRDKGIKKIGGESCLEVGGSLFRFFSGDSPSCFASEEILSVLSVLNLHMRTVKV